MEDRSSKVEESNIYSLDDLREMADPLEISKRDRFPLTGSARYRDRTEKYLNLKKRRVEAMDLLGIETLIENKEIFDQETLMRARHSKLVMYNGAFLFSSAALFGLGLYNLLKLAFD